MTATVGEEILQPVAKAVGAEEQAALRDWLSDDSTREVTAEGVAQFRESYVGTWDKAEDYVWELYSDMELPGWADSHRGRVIAGITNDMKLGGEMWTANAPRLRVRVFLSH